MSLPYEFSAGLVKKCVRLIFSGSTTETCPLFSGIAPVGYVAMGFDLWDATIFHEYLATRKI